MKVKVSTDELFTAADKLENLLREYTACHKEIVSNTFSTQFAWRGKDAVKYAAAILEFDRNIATLESLVEEYAKFLRICARNYDEVDQKVYKDLCNV